MNRHVADPQHGIEQQQQADRALRRNSAGAVTKTALLHRPASAR
jgi:hypothetical protein